MKKVEIEVLKQENKTITIPEYKTKYSSGVDLKSTDNYEIFPNEVQLIKTGLKLAIPEGFEGQVRTRSGLALKNQIIVLNSPGTIDSDYRGEIGVILINLSKKLFKIEKGDRIAQLIIAPVIQGNFKFVNQLSKTKRGSGGFGSTGVKK